MNISQSPTSNSTLDRPLDASSNSSLPLAARLNTAEHSEHPELSANTAPAPSKGLRRLLGIARGKISIGILPLMQRAARAYVGGETLQDALCVARRLTDEGITSTLGLWPAIDSSARQVADEYLAAIDQLSESGLDSYLSIKPPSLRFSRELAVELAAAAHPYGVRLHCDSHGPEVADASCAMIESMLLKHSAHDLSTTLPGRWSRSLTDADWGIERGLKVRVVKGEFPDPADPLRDMRAGFLEVIDRLAGRAHHVAVASHDVPLAAEAIRRLRAAGTSCESELLYACPMTQSLRWAREHDVPVRFYIPYGKGYIPYAIRHLRRNPRIVWWMMKDLVARGISRH
jgi:proline dehydrogenase